MSEKLRKTIWGHVKKGQADAYSDYLKLITCENNGIFCKDKELLKESIKLRKQIFKFKSDLDIKTINNTLKKALLFESHMNFDSYCQYIEYEREPEKQFYLPRRSVLRNLAENMNKLMWGEYELLTLSLPPGIGKSTLGIFFLSWNMGLFPDRPNLASAHSGTLTKNFYDGVSQILQDPEYLWHDVFPDAVKIITNSKDETIDINSLHRFSSLTCRAINASLTGATRCEGVLYADDLCSGIEEALSRERMDNLWMKYTNDLKSRKKMSAKELHIATRWTIHDVIGRLEREYSNNKKAKFITLPALNQEGKSNFNYDYNLGFDEKYFLDMKSQLDDASFCALYMNQPYEREGLLYFPDQLREYFELPIGEPDSIIGACDCKDVGGDYLFLPIAYVYGSDYYVEDCVCNNGDLGIIDAEITHKLIKHKVRMCRFESNSSGGRFAEKIQAQIKELGGITHITTKFSTSHKETRIITAAPWIREHCLFKLKSDNYEYKKMISMLCSWTMTGKNKYDDVPDGMAQFANFAISLSGNTVEFFKRFF